MTLGAVTGLALTWKQLTDYVPNALTGRAWIENLAVAPIVIFGVVAALPCSGSRPTRRICPASSPRSPSSSRSSSLLKVLVTSWAFREAIRRGLIGGTPCSASWPSGSPSSRPRSASRR